MEGRGSEKRRTNEVGSLDVASSVDGNVERLDELLLGTEESKGKEDEIGREELLRSDLKRKEERQWATSQRRFSTRRASNETELTTSSIFQAPPASLVHSTRTVLSPVSFPFASLTKSLVEMEYSVEEEKKERERVSEMQSLKSNADC